MAPPNTETRGLSDDPVPEDYKRSNTNLIIVNGCPPNQTVWTVSFIAKGFFDILLESRTNNGTIMIPDFNQKLSTYRPNGMGSLTFEISEPILLFGPEPEKSQMPKMVLAMTEKLKDRFEALESEKKILEIKAKEQAEKTEKAEMEQKKLHE